MKKYTFLLFLLFLFSQKSLAQKLNASFFDEADVFFQTYVKNGKVKYAALQNSEALPRLIAKIEEADLTDLNATAQKAFYINAYNLWVIKIATEAYPLTSVKEVTGFFDRKKIKVAGEFYSLNAFEKMLLKLYEDPRLHFVLNCGALSCPPISDKAYRPQSLEQQMETQSKTTINDARFVHLENNNLYLSKIFEWYAQDFGKNKKEVLSFINQYRKQAIPPTSLKIKYDDYDWSLNAFKTKMLSLPESATQASPMIKRYVVSSTIPKGSTETKIFNNLYTQRTGSNGELNARATFFTTLITSLYGVSGRINVGLNAKYRRVGYQALPARAIDVFVPGSSEGQFRQRLTGLGPMLRWAPVTKWKNFSVQSALTFPTGKDLSGNSTAVYIDWDGTTWNTQFFNDVSIGRKFFLFMEVDFLWEDIGKASKGRSNRLSTPATLIFSYLPKPKITLYVMSAYSPYWQIEFDYFVQGGIGAKYQFSPKVELEVLYTAFRNKFLLANAGRAATYNIGLRFNVL